MTRVAGASQYVNQARLANQQGISAQSPNVLGTVADSASLLDTGRQLAAPGIGLSSNARALNKQFLQGNADLFNSMFSVAGGADGTIEGAQTIINSLRSTLPQSDVHESVRGKNIDEQA